LYFAPILRHLRGLGLTVESDNSVTVYNLQRQGAGVALLHMTRKIFSLLERLDLRVCARHIPGKENEWTDALSRLEASGDYQLRPDIFYHAICTLGIHPTVDLFAASHNRKCSRYWAWKDPNPGAEGQDAFSIPQWSKLAQRTEAGVEGLPYIFPPVGLLKQVLRRLTDERMAAILVLPKWPSQPWWNLFRPLAKVVIEAGSAKEVLIPGPLMTQSVKKKKLPLGMWLVALIHPASTSTDYA
jgi:hypothetical protein